MMFQPFKSFRPSLKYSDFQPGMKILRVDCHATGNTNYSNMIHCNRKLDSACKYIVKNTQENSDVFVCVKNAGHLPDLILHNAD